MQFVQSTAGSHEGRAKKLQKCLAPYRISRGFGGNGGGVGMQNETPNPRGFKTGCNNKPTALQALRQPRRIHTVASMRTNKAICAMCQYETHELGQVERLKRVINSQKCKKKEKE